MTDETRQEPTVDEIVAEVERRVEARGSRETPGQSSPPLSPAGQRVVIGVDRAIYWLAKRWLAIFNVAAFLYIGLPFLAPTLMFLGADGAAALVYTLYRPLCHQLPFRSWFLFGSQWAYTWDELSRLVGAAGLIEHGYVGDAALGFKVALCQRDVAIYGMILLGGLAYAIFRRRAKPMPLWAYVLFGIVPIGLDGGSQLLSRLVLWFFPSADFPMIESTPLRRTITGALFGLATLWLAYPTLEEATQEIIGNLEKKAWWKERAGSHRSTSVDAGGGES